MNWPTIHPWVVAVRRLRKEREHEAWLRKWHHFHYPLSARRMDRAEKESEAAVARLRALLAKR